MQDKIKGYSRVQVGLHWAVVVLVAFQFLAHNAIEAAWNAGGARPAAEAANPVLTTMHIVAGLLVLAMALARIYLRITRGAPEPPADEPRIMKIISEAVHGLIYVMLLSLPSRASWPGSSGSGLLPWRTNICRRACSASSQPISAGRCSSTLSAGLTS